MATNQPTTTRQPARPQPALQKQQQRPAAPALSSAQTLEILDGLCDQVAAAAHNVMVCFNLVKAAQKIPANTVTDATYPDLQRSLADFLASSNRFWRFATPAQLPMIRRALGAPWLPSVPTIPDPLSQAQARSGNAVQAIGRLAQELRKDATCRWHFWYGYNKKMINQSLYLKKVNAPYVKTATATRSAQVQLNMKAQATTARFARMLHEMNRVQNTYDLITQSFPS